MGLRWILAFAFGLTLGFVGDGCASLAAFTYKYYGVDAATYDGTLLGPKPVDDLSLKLCEPTEKDRSPCVLMLKPEFFRLKGDYLVLESQLSACQRK